MSEFSLSYWSLSIILCYSLTPVSFLLYCVLFICELTSFNFLIKYLNSLFLFFLPHSPYSPWLVTATVLVMSLLYCSTPLERNIFRSWKMSLTLRFNAESRSWTRAFSLDRQAFSRDGLWLSGMGHALRRGSGCRGGDGVITACLGLASPPPPLIPHSFLLMMTSVVLSTPLVIIYSMLRLRQATNFSEDN